LVLKVRLLAGIGSLKGLSLCCFGVGKSGAVCKYSKTVVCPLFPYQDEGGVVQLLTLRSPANDERSE
jgi:hypothetical protein